MAEPPRRADDDGRRAPQQQVQALLFHRRLETADNRHIGFPKRPGQILGLKDRIAG